MRAGRQWLALDAEFMFNPFTERLLERFGPAGVVTWVAFLCACKRSPLPGTIVIAGEHDARVQLQIETFDLVDNDGQLWTMDDFFRFTGEQKQTRKTRRTRAGRVQNVCATHWERWQKDARTQDARERQRRSRAGNGRDTAVTASEQGCDTAVTEKEREKETPPTPPRGAESSFLPPDPGLSREEQRERVRALRAGGNGNQEKPETAARRGEDA